MFDAAVETVAEKKQKFAKGAFGELGHHPPNGKTMTAPALAPILPVMGYAVLSGMIATWIAMSELLQVCAYYQLGWLPHRHVDEYVMSAFADSSRRLRQTAVHY